MQGGISKISWTVYGKIQTITKTDGSVINYTYDASGNRISKTVQSTNEGVASTVSTYYVRDASGNVMSIYESGTPAVNNNHLTQSEIDLYGSSRLGVYNVSTDVQNCSAGIDSISNFTRGNKFFELTNHLGNVLATVSDRKLSVDSNNDGTVDYYTPNVITASDYSAFGATLPDRNYNTQLSKYGFNGQLKSDEIGADQYTAESWQYDARIGKRWNVDPLASKFPWQSPYCGLDDNPTNKPDPTGAGTEDLHIKGPDGQQAFNELQSSVGGYLNLSMDANGKVGYSPVVLPTGQTVAPNEAAQRLMLAVDDHSVDVNVTATSSNINSQGHLYTGGAFMGNTVTPASSSNTPASGTDFNPLISQSTETSSVQIPLRASGEACANNVQTQQEVNPTVLGAMDNYYEKPGASILHEITESYIGGALSQQSGTSSPAAGQPGSVYQTSHNSAAPQPGPVVQHVLDTNGTEIYPTPTGSYPGAARVNFDVKSDNKPAQTIETYP